VRLYGVATTRKPLSANPVNRYLKEEEEEVEGGGGGGGDMG